MQYSISTNLHALGFGTLWGHTITQIENKSVLLIGGKQSFVNRCNRWYKRPANVLKGKLCKEMRNMSWAELASLNESRTYHTSFKTNGNLYVTGGKNDCSVWITATEIYCLKQEMWSLGRPLPNPLRFIRSAVNEDDKFVANVGLSIENSTLEMLIFHQGEFRNLKLQVPGFVSFAIVNIVK